MITIKTYWEYRVIFFLSLPVNLSEAGIEIVSNFKLRRQELGMVQQSASKVALHCVKK